MSDGVKKSYTLREVFVAIAYVLVAVVLGIAGAIGVRDLCAQASISPMLVFPLMLSAFLVIAGAVYWFADWRVRLKERS